MVQLYKATIPLVLNQPAPAGAQVDYATEDDTAVSGNDYVSLSGTLNFAEGDTQAEVQVTTRHPYTGAPAQFRLRLSNPLAIALASDSLDVVLPGITRRTLFLDTFAGTGPLQGRTPDIGGNWTEYGDGGLLPITVSGGVAVLEDDTGVEGDNVSLEAALAEAITPGAGIASVRALFTQPSVNAERGEQVIDFELYSAIGPDYRYILLDWKDNTVQMGGTGAVNSPGRLPFDLSALPAQFTVELRWDVDGPYTGLYIEGQHVMSLQADPISDVVEFVYASVNGLTGLQIDNYIVEQGVPDAVDAPNHTVPLHVYTKDTFSTDTELLGHYPETGNGNSWIAFNHSAAGALVLTGGDVLSFENMGESETMGARIPANLGGASFVKLKAVLTSLPTTGEFLMGLADSPMIGQSYSGAQVKLDFAAQTLTIQGIYGSQTVPFPSGWSFEGTLDFEMVLQSGQTKAVARLDGLYAGAYELEGAVGSMDNFVVFFNASVCPDLRLTEITVMEASPEEYT